MAFNIKDFAQESLKVQPTITTEDSLSGLPNGKSNQMDYRELKEIKQKVVMKMIDLQSLNDVVSEIKEIVDTQKINIASLKTELEEDPQVEENNAGEGSVGSEGQEGVPGSEIDEGTDPSSEGVSEGTTGTGDSISGIEDANTPVEGSEGEGATSEPASTEGQPEGQEGEPSGTEGEGNGGETPAPDGDGDTGGEPEENQNDEEKDQATDQASEGASEEIQSEEPEEDSKGEEKLTEESSEEDIKKEDQKTEASMERFSGRLGFDSKKDLLKSLGLESRQVRYTPLNKREERIIKYWNSLEDNKEICKTLSSIVFSDSKEFRRLLDQLIENFNNLAIPLTESINDKELLEKISQRTSLSDSILGRDNFKDFAYRVLFTTPDYLARGLDVVDACEEGMGNMTIIGVNNGTSVNVLTYPKPNRGLISKIDITSLYNSDLEQEVILKDLGSKLTSPIKILDNVIIAIEMLQKLHEIKLANVINSFNEIYNSISSAMTTHGLKLSTIREKFILKLVTLSNVVMTAITIQEEIFRD